MNEQELKEQIKQELKQEMKKSRRKKRIIFLIIFIVIISVVAFVIILNNKRNTGMTKEEFAQYVTAVQITTENWLDYFELENITEENTDAFGEVTSIIKKTGIKTKEDNIYSLDVVLEVALSDKEILFKSIDTQTFIINGISSYVSEIYDINLTPRKPEENVSDYTFTIDYLECTRATGTLYILDLPEEEWKVNPDFAEGKKYFCVDGIYYYFYDVINSLCSEVTNGNAET